ncbi:MAG TPA: hypothetical protein EYG86_06460 [Crocinitomicaceae bacterium]|nr:hypothetical protein [Crocinitomicaceae bacterium]
MTSQEIREIYQNQYDLVVSSKDEKALISHYGSFSQDLVSSISTNAESLLLSKGTDKGIVKRIFSILIEGLQNIRLHGQKDEADRQLSFLILSECPDSFCLSFANVINPDDFQKVDKYIEKINSYSKEELKETYLSVLTNEYISEKGGAGLGFITTRMKSGQPLEHSYYALSDGNMLFTFKIKIAKSK